MPEQTSARKSYMSIKLLQPLIAHETTCFSENKTPPLKKYLPGLDCVEGLFSLILSLIDYIMSASVTSVFFHFCLT